MLVMKINGIHKKERSPGVQLNLMQCEIIKSLSEIQGLRKLSYSFIME